MVVRGIRSLMATLARLAPLGMGVANLRHLRSTRACAIVRPPSNRGVIDGWK